MSHRNFFFVFVFCSLACFSLSLSSTSNIKPIKYCVGKKSCHSSLISQCAHSIIFVRLMRARLLVRLRSTLQSAHHNTPTLYDYIIANNNNIIFRLTSLIFVNLSDIQFFFLPFCVKFIFSYHSALRSLPPSLFSDAGAHQMDKAEQVLYYKAIKYSRSRYIGKKAMKKKEEIFIKMKRWKHIYQREEDEIRTVFQWIVSWFSGQIAK